MKKDNYEAVRSFMKATASLGETSMKMEDIYFATMRRDPTATAYIYFDESGKAKKRTYDDFQNLVFKTASKLSRLLSDTPHGTVVGLKLKNSYRWGVFFYAILMSGHRPLLIDARLAKANTDNLLKQAGAKALIANDEEEFCVPHFRINDVLNQEADYSFEPDWADHVIFCSSGTTGEAKMMIYNGRNLCHQIMASLDMPESTVDLMYPSKDLRILAMLPFHHIFGFVAVFLWYTFYGKTLVYPSSLATTDLLYAAKKGKVTHLYSVPLFWDGVAQTLTRQVSLMGPSTADLFAKMIAYNNHKISKKEAGVSSRKFITKKFQNKVLGKHIRYAISGGGFLSPKTSSIINGLGYPLYNGFGMTEVGVTSVEMSPRVEQRLKGSIGKPLFGVEYKIGGDKVSKDENGLLTGELFVRSPYVHEKEIVGGKIVKTKTEDGFFPTGDIAYCDASGSYFLKGRIKDTIILSNGENVFPDEIEYYFKDVKHLVNVACLGATLPGEAEEKITLVCEVDNSVDEAMIEKILADIESINASLPSEKKVQTVLIDRRPLPMSGSMKVKRFQIKEAIEKGSKDFIDPRGEKKKEINFEGYDPKEVEEVCKKVTKVFSKVLLLPEFKIEPDAIWNTDLGGDSMSYIDMVAKLDEEFQIKIPEDLYGILGSVNDFAKEVLDLLEEKAPKKNSKKSNKKSPKKGKSSKKESKK